MLPLNRPFCPRIWVESAPNSIESYEKLSAIGGFWDQSDAPFISDTNTDSRRVLYLAENTLSAVAAINTPCSLTRTAARQSCSPYAATFFAVAIAIV